MSDNEGLTRPLINNIGGMIDQDAPSADQLLEGHDEDVLDDTGAVEGGRAPHVDDPYSRSVDDIYINSAGTLDGGTEGPRINPD